MKYNGKYVLVEMGGINLDHTGEGVPMKIWTNQERSHFLSGLAMGIQTRWAKLSTGRIEVEDGKPQEPRGENSY